MVSVIDTTIEHLKAGLHPAARAEFGELEELILRRHMAYVGMKSLPDPAGGDPYGEWASGQCECRVCGHPYGRHPPDWRVIGYGNVPYLTILCDGRRVKL